MTPTSPNPNRWPWRLLACALAVPLLGAADAPAVPDGMVEVPAGPALLGDEEGGAGPVPRREVEVQAFAIDRTEVSNAAYARFLEAVEAEGGAAWAHPHAPEAKDHTPRYWKPYVPSLVRERRVGALMRAKRDTFRQPDHPVVGVDFWDARAFCAWRGARLPTADEWEKAARGEDGRLWPWGSEWAFTRANTGGYERSGERDGHTYTAPVESYAEGASPSGALNMAGNAWEWTASGDDGERVLKGGAFNSYPSSVRAAHSARYEPDYRSFDIGFRCAADLGGGRR